MNFLEKFSPEEFTISAFVIGYILRDHFNVNEQNALGNWFMLVGQTLETSAAQLQVVQNNSNNNIENRQNSDIENLKKAVEIINQKLNQ